MFPLVLKILSKKQLDRDLKWLLKAHPDIRNRLNIEPETFHLDDKVFGKKDVKEFIKQNKVRIESLAKRFIRPRLEFVGYADATKEYFRFFADDFYEYVLYKCSEGDSIDECFENCWKKFESDFFGERIEVQFIARVKQLRGGAGIGLDNVIKYKGIKLSHFNCTYDYKLLGWSRQSRFIYKFDDYFDHPWIKITESHTLSLNEHIDNYLPRAKNNFDLCLLIIRCVVGGSCFFNDLRVFGLGHYSCSNLFSFFPHSINDIYLSISDYSNLPHPQDWWISNAFKKITNFEYENFIFSDWNIRLSKTLPKPSDEFKATQDEEFYLFSNLLNTTSAYNSLVFDKGNRENAKFRKVFLPILINRYFGWNTDTLSRIAEDLYDIRGKLVHGHYVRARELLHQKFKNIEELRTYVNLFTQVVSDLIILSLVNSNFLRTIEDWYDAGDPTADIQLIKPFVEISNDC